MGLGLLGCSGGSATPGVATLAPLQPTAASSATAAPTASWTPTAASLPSPSPQLETTTIMYSGARSVEDLNTLMLDLRAVAGVDDVQGGASQLVITYDPAQTNRQQLVQIVRNHGYTVKES